MIESIAIRTADLVCAPVIAALHEVCFEDSWNAETVANLLAAFGGFGLIAIKGAEPIAFAIGRVAADESEILAIGVVPALRRIGIGGRLLGATLLNAGQFGARRVFLEVAEDNASARSFYAAHGFVSVGRRRGYYWRLGKKATDALILSRSLEP